MRELNLWKFLLRCLEEDETAGLLIVVDSQGSSPGRMGFKMVVARDGRMEGSIGGGIMEHKLVEYVHDRLEKRLPFWEVKRQIHSKEAPHDQSGMICSGEQTIALLKITHVHLPLVVELMDHLEAGEKMNFHVDHEGFRIAEHTITHSTVGSLQQADGQWSFEQTIGPKEIAHVIGAGHVGLEMCKILAGLDFFVVNYDDRPDLNTMQANTFAHRKIVTPYPEIHRYIDGGPDVYVVVMTFGYRGDDEAVRALLGRRFKYFGMMGSEAKVAKLLGDLHKDGYAADAIAQLRTPAGMVAHCKTPAEIAVSIAAEMLSVRYAID